MKRRTIEERLSNLPPAFRTRILQDKAAMAPGAISVVGRLFDMLAERGEHHTSPYEETFRRVCQSESTLGTLLRTLDVHLPEVNLTIARKIRKEWYRMRPAASAPSSPRRKKGKNRPSPVAWPDEWLALHQRLIAAPLKDSSIDKYITDINRCAKVLDQCPTAPDIGWMLAHELSQAFQKDGLRSVTAAGHITGVIALGSYGGLGKLELDGMRTTQQFLMSKARRGSKRKIARVENLYEKGGFAYAVEKISELLDRADSLGDWRVEAIHARATAAIIGVTINIPARSGDVAKWRLGRDLSREPSGKWQLKWIQQKTGVFHSAGTLWPEIGTVLDQHILGGLPPRFAQHRYEQLIGMNWLTFEVEPYERRWPSEKVSLAIGVPLHDMRTLAADYMRMHEPGTAANHVSALLGHSSSAAGEAYRALANETSCQRDWQAVRSNMAK